MKLQPNQQTLLMKIIVIVVQKKDYHLAQVRVQYQQTDKRMMYRKDANVTADSNALVTACIKLITNSVKKEFIY